ncbi:unnamed protein product [Pleuronectes platessa]|uniref:Uncharacterized protein n=1 Tax=Pleuronectes platessa TaxID=8262 RepID=A0A9N7UK71_PLEPL|nr:unnamed protein product [Pleuronectes platessa]
MNGVVAQMEIRNSGPTKSVVGGAKFVWHPGYDKLPRDSKKAMAITEKIAQFIVLDDQPLSVAFFHNPPTFLLLPQPVFLSLSLFLSCAHSSSVRRCLTLTSSSS